jgi:ribosomal protein S18 acetylase RimI-like enzyme
MTYSCVIKTEFGTVVYRCMTDAPNEKKARSNAQYRYAKRMAYGGRPGSWRRALSDIKRDYRTICTPATGPEVEPKEEPETPSKYEPKKYVQKGLFDSRLDRQLAILEYKIEYFDEYADDYDPWVVYDQAELIFKKSDLRTNRDKELRIVALEDDNVLGAVFSEMREEDDRWVYSFDVAVDPSKRDDKVGLKLIDAAIQDFKSEQAEFGNVELRVMVVNPKLTKYLERKYGFDVIESAQEDGPRSATYDIMTYSG